MGEAQCPIWRTIIDEPPPAGGDYTIVNSARAGGRYRITGSTEAQIKANQTRFNDRVKAKLTTWIIDHARLGELPEVTSNTFKVVEQGRNLLPWERADRLLRHFALSSEHIGTEVSFDLGIGMNLGSDDAMLLAWSDSLHATEVEFLIRYLEERRWARIKWKESATDPAGTAVVTPEGYARLAELDQEAFVLSQAFVAMWFSNEMNAAYFEGIEPAIRDAGYSSLRIDRRST